MDLRVITKQEEVSYSGQSALFGGVLKNVDEKTANRLIKEKLCEPVEPPPSVLSSLPVEKLEEAVKKAEEGIKEPVEPPPSVSLKKTVPLKGKK